MVNEEIAEEQERPSVHTQNRTRGDGAIRRVCFCERVLRRLPRLSESIQRQALVGLILVSSAAMTVVIAFSSVALVSYLVAVCALLAASIVAAALLTTERR